MARILVTQLGFLGDVILSTPVFSALKAHYPNDEITILTTAAALPLVRHHPAISEAIGYDKRKSDAGFGGFYRMLKEIREGRFDRVFSLHRSLRTTLLHFASRIPERYGFSEASGASLYSKTTTRREYDHDVLRNLAILKNIGLDPLKVPGTITIGLTDGAISEAKERCSETSYVVVAPGSVWPTKRWTVQGFGALCRLMQDRGETPVLIGGPDDSECATVIERLSGAKNLVGKLSLLGSAAVISGARAVITNDSAPLHIASAFQRPTVALFCATIPEFGFGPWHTKSEVIGVEGLSCRPCGRHGKTFCPTGTHACQIGITPERVLHSLERVLERG